MCMGTKDVHGYQRYMCMGILYSASYVYHSVFCVYAVLLNSGDGRLLDMKIINFDTTSGCVYCPAGQCDCFVSL